MNILNHILNRTQRLPKFVGPATHASLDYFTVAYFMIVAGAMWGRHRRAAASALINGGMVLGLSMLTDYPGGLRKISFRDHGKGDILQMFTAASLPTLLGFGGSAAALPLHLQAMNEFAVIGVTDFDAQQPRRSRRSSAA